MTWQTELTSKKILIANNELVGDGSKDAEKGSPYRRLEQWWDAESGKLLWEYDPYTNIVKRFTEYGFTEFISK